MLPALAIFGLFFGPQRGWIFILLIGLFELSAGFVAFWRSRSSASSWFAVAIGIIMLAVGIRLAFAPV
jgi:threonine/homoserine/homoserine lactone efflux protein